VCTKWITLIKVIISKTSLTSHRVNLELLCNAFWFRVTKFSFRVLCMHCFIQKNIYMLETENHKEIFSLNINASSTHYNYFSLVWTDLAHRIVTYKRNLMLFANSYQKQITITICLVSANKWSHAFIYIH
jgi:hypothetical protein